MSKTKTLNAQHTFCTTNNVKHAIRLYKDGHSINRNRRDFDFVANTYTEAQHNCI